MTFVEIRFKKNEVVILAWSKIQLNLDLEESIKFIEPLFESLSNIDFIYIKDIDQNQILKLEKLGNAIEKSFILNLIELDAIF
jgi:hypothetical protein